MMITTLLLAQLSLFCGTRDSNYRIWSHPERYHFRAHTRGGIPELIELQTISVSWPRTACARTRENFLSCAGQGENGSVAEGPIVARDLIVRQRDEFFIVELEVNGIKRAFRRDGPCKLREENF